MRKSRTILALILFTAVLISQCFTAYAANTPDATFGALWTTDAAGQKNNGNHYATIADVFLNGGPNGGVGFTAGHTYYVKVETPNGQQQGSTFTVVPQAANGVVTFSVCLSAINAPAPLAPGEYKVVVCINSGFKNSDSMSDNFQIDGGSTPNAALLTIVKRITGQGYSANDSFGVKIAPATAGQADIIGSVSVSHSYSVSVPYGTYTVSETSMPSGYTQSGIAPSATVTVGAGGATVTITNNYGTSAPPVAVDDYYQMAKDATLSLTTSGLLSNDSDPDGDVITFTQVTVGAEHGTVTTPDNAGAFTYTPSAGYTGEDHFHYQIIDEDGLTATAIVHITISATTGHLTITKAITTQDAGPATQFTVSIKPDGGTASTRTITVGTPLELDLTPGWYTISEINVPAGYTPSYNPTDGRVQVTLGGTFTVAINNAYVHPNNPPVAVDDSYTLPKNSPATSLTIMSNDSDPDKDAISLVSVGTPLHGSVSKTGNNVSYTPEPNTIGQDTFTYVIQDEHGAQATATVTITITETKGTLTIRKAITTQDVGPVDLFTFSITPDGGVPFSQTVEAGTTVSLDLEPGGYTVQETSVADYTPSYNPIDGHVHVTTGTTVSVIVSNAYYHANQPPVAVDDTYSVAKNAPATNLPVMGNDYDPDNGDTISLLSITQPTHGTAVISGNTVNYTPTTDYFGPDSFTYTIKDAHGATDTATVTITITDTVGTLTISKAITTNPAGPLTSFAVTITLDGGSAHTHATVLAGGSVSVSLEPGWYTVTEDADTHYQPTYTPSDGRVEVTTGAIATVGIANEFINNPPVAVNDSYSVAKNSSATNLPIMSNDSDPDNDVISLVSITQPSHGSASVSGNTVNYTPTAGYTGPDTFTYTIQDAHGLQATATVTITITETKGTLTISKTITSQVPGPLNSFAVTITPVNGGDHTHATVIAGSSVSVDLEPGLYDVTEDTVPDYRPTYTPSSRVQVTTGTTVTVGIANEFINNPPVAVNDSYTLPKNAPATNLQVMLNDSDPDSDVISLSTNTAPQHGTASISDGKLVYTPVAGYVGPDTFTYTIADAHGLLATATVTITIFETDGTVTITKQITGDSGWDPNQTFPVTITQVVDGEVTPFVRQGVVSVNQPWNVPVPQGYYLVTEGSMPSSRYSPVSISNEGYFELGSTAMVTVTNRYTAPNPPPANYPPVAVDDQASTLRETPVTVPVLLNDSDPDGDPLSITGTSTPGNGAATVIGNQITYTPAVGFLGTDTFTYTITDGQGHTATATVTVDVIDIDEPIPGGPTDLPKTGGINPLVYCGAGLALAGVGLVLRKRK